MLTQRPIVGLPCDHRLVDGLPFDMVGEKYIVAARDGAGATPLLIPVLEEPLPPAEILATLDGILFPGSPSNISPNLYGGPAPRKGNIADPVRDTTTLSLIEAVLRAGVPALFICRGLQELNVALGGTLFQHVQEVPGRLDHTAEQRKTFAEKYGPAHPIQIEAGGVLAGLFGTGDFTVNSLHAQAIDRLAPGLKVEARAPDGTIEAVSMPVAKGFLLAVQWHPEWRWWENAQSRILFEAFGEALRAHRAARGRKEPAA
jgi:putative glutamine amidotransferase